MEKYSKSIFYSFLKEVTLEWNSGLTSILKAAEYSFCSMKELPETEPVVAESRRISISCVRFSRCHAR